jgi:hypothetical protein
MLTTRATFVLEIHCDVPGCDQVLCGHEGMTLPELRAYVRAERASWYLSLNIGQDMCPEHSDQDKPKGAIK